MKKIAISILIIGAVVTLAALLNYDAAINATQNLDCFSDLCICTEMQKFGYEICGREMDHISIFEKIQAIF